jgi:metallo-beta-lactamase class B
LKKLGLDPAKLKYAIVTHGHDGHIGGAKYLQEKFGTRIIMSAAEWDILEQSPRDPTKPKRDMVATDGQKLTLGDTTVMLYLTPGHTPGTISALIPVKDGGRSRLAAEWGGTAFSFEQTAQNFQTYIASVKRFSDIVAKASADTLIAPLTIYDGSKTKLPAVLKRKPGEPHPYVVGTDSVLRYLKVTEECAELALLRTKQRGR